MADKPDDQYWLTEGGEIMRMGSDGGPEDLDEVQIVNLLNESRTQNESLRAEVGRLDTLVDHQVTSLSEAAGEYSERVGELAMHLYEYACTVSRLEPKVVSLEAELAEAKGRLEFYEGRRCARNQVCGCVVCNCEDDERCHGCGGKMCCTDACVFKESGKPRVIYENQPTLLQAIERADAAEGLIQQVRGQIETPPPPTPDCVEGQTDAFSLGWREMAAQLAVMLQEAPTPNTEGCEVEPS